MQNTVPKPFLKKRAIYEDLKNDILPSIFVGKTPRPRQV